MDICGRDEKSGREEKMSDIEQSRASTSEREERWRARERERERERESWTAGTACAEVVRTQK